MKLFITGGGEQENFIDLDQKFLNSLPQNSNILIIPTACEEEDFEYILDRITDAFNGYVESSKISQIELSHDIAGLTLERLASYDALVFEGGNTFKLISEARESSFFNHIKSYALLDKIIYADSAGAIILGLDIQTAFIGEDADRDHLKLQDYRGLNILTDWSVHCHYEIEERESLQTLIYTTGSPVICIPESMGIYWQGSQFEVFGEGRVEVIDFESTVENRKSLYSGEQFNITS